MKNFLKIIFLIPYITKGRIAFYMSLTITGIFFEGFSMAMLYPVMDFIEKGKDFTKVATSSKMWLFIGRAFDFLVIPKNLLGLMGTVFILFVMREVFVYWKDRYMAWLTENISHDIRSVGYKRLSEADISFFDKYGVGELTNVVIGVDGIRASNGVMAFFSVLSSSMTMLVYLGILLIFSPRLTLVSIAIMGFVGFILKSKFTRTTKMGNEVSQYNSTIASAILERLNGIRLVKLAAKESHEIGVVEELSGKIMKKNYSISRIRAKMEFTIGILVFFAASLIIYFSTEFFHLTLAKIGIFVFILIRLAEYAKPTFKTSQTVLGYLGSIKRVKKLTDEAVVSKTIQGGDYGKFKLNKGIQFRDVAFSYYKDVEVVLDHITIFIPSGKMTALVGRSGAGKSTLVDLIPRLRVPTQGTIAIDDVPIEQFDLQVLRRSIAFVTQESFLFNDTIENNIKYVHSEASHEEVVKAAEMAYADPFIREFPQGYQTVVGERGVRLSGGQRQRIILARALLQGASIIILDEPTSSLDSESEQNIQKAMEKLRMEQKFTILIIAHRLSTIKSADQIIVIDKGVVVEQGSHADLMHEDTWYADMVRIQSNG